MEWRLLRVGLPWLLALGCSDPQQAASGGSPDDTGGTSEATGGANTTMTTAGVTSLQTSGADSGTSAASDGPTSGVSSATMGSATDTGATGGATTTGVASATDSGTTGGMADTGTTDGGGSTGTTGAMVTLGFACMMDSDCNELAGEECCDAAQCLDTCMVPCNMPNECPVEGMGCEHGYCLFPCNDNDADCAMWPGYTCQHQGNYCEKD
jgi:hypothetical protein